MAIRKLHKYSSALLIMVLVALSVGACQTAPAPQPTTAPAVVAPVATEAEAAPEKSEPAATKRVALLMPGVITDQSWSRTWLRRRQVVNR